MIGHFQLGAEYLAFRCINLSLVLVVLVFSSDIGTEFVTIESTIETTRRGGAPGTDGVGAAHYRPFYG